tara:strand:+ start:409 stop:687 length:279 start_codon:yes stop_codon:yes gene_type:complete
MDKLKPVAWKCERNGQSIITTDKYEAALQGFGDGVKVTSLYTLPEGHVIVPVEKVKQEWGYQKGIDSIRDQEDFLKFISENLIAANEDRYGE